MSTSPSAGSTTPIIIAAPASVDAAPVQIPAAALQAVFDAVPATPLSMSQLLPTMIQLPPNVTWAQVKMLNIAFDSAGNVRITLRYSP